MQIADILKGSYSQTWCLSGLLGKKRTIMQVIVNCPYGLTVKNFEKFLF